MTTITMMNEILSTTDLKTAWAELRQAYPRMRTRDAAEHLGVSEAELLATGCGNAVTRLKPDWYTLFEALEGLGEVMALTRNDVCVHEKVGVYRNIERIPDHEMGMVLDENVDLRLFFKHWHHAFAVVNGSDGQERRSLQFFDAHGTAVHKIHLRPESSMAHFEALVAQFRHEDQAATQAVLPPSAPRPERPEADIDVAGLREAWDALQDTHDFIFLLRRFKVGRVQALRLAGPRFARPVSTNSLRAILEQAAEAELPIMVFVGNPGCVQIHSGPVHTLKAVEGWYNVLDPGFNLHVREALIEGAWVVRKPTRDGDVHSLECYDAAGDVVCYLFSKRKEGQFESEAWRTLLHGLASSGETSTS